MGNPGEAKQRPPVQEKLPLKGGTQPLKVVSRRLKVVSGACHLCLWRWLHSCQLRGSEWVRQLLG